MHKASLFAVAAVAASALTFPTPSQLVVSRLGLTPVSIATADFNRDGVPDIAAGNLGTPPLSGSQISTIGVLFGVRGSAPGGLNELSLEGTVIEIAAADFTGDGNPDVAALTVTAAGTRICVLPGTGTGGFAATVCSAAGGSPSRMTVADFDRDGRADIFLLRTFDSKVAALRSTGGGVFTEAATATVTAPAALAVGEWNGDAIPDVAVVSRTGAVVLLVSGGGNLFQSMQTVTAPVAASDIVALDLNRDGRPDLVITDPQLATLSYFLGGNNSAAYLGPLRSLPFTARGTLLQLADLNGDSLPEIVAATSAGMLAISTNADGTLNIPNPPGAPPAGARSFAAGDFNGDGRTDLAVVDGTAAWLLTGQATATVTQLDVTPVASSYGQRMQVTVRVLLAALTPAALPLTGASVQLLDGATVLQTLPLTATAAGSQELANARIEVLLPAGTRDLTARFTGTAAFSGSTAPPVRVTVAPAASTVRFQSAPAEVSYTQGLRVNAVVNGTLNPASEGVVRLLVNGSVVAQGLVNAGISQLVIPPFAPLGKIRVQLQYEGMNFLPSSSEEVTYVVKGGTVTAASAASYRPGVAPDSLAVLAVPGLVRESGTAAASLPWPQSLGGVEAEIRDTPSGPGVRAGLTYAGSGQVNIQVPPRVTAGPKRVVLSIDGVAEAATGEMLVQAVAPGLFTADGSGTGPAAAYAALYRADGSVADQTLFRCEAGRCFTIPMDSGQAGDRLILTVYGTGWRGGVATTATIDGRPAEILFTGAHPEIPGLDQANIIVPAGLAGRGEVDIFVITGGVVSNGAKLSLR